MARDRLKICYVLNTFDIGGAETVVLDLARGHDASRFDVEVLAALEPERDGEPEMRRRLREAGVRTAALTQRNFRSPLALARLFLYLKRRRFDIVHGHNRGSDYWAARLAPWAGVHHAFWTRHLVYQDMSERQIQRYRTLSRRIDRVIAVSESVRKSCLEVEQVSPGQVVTVANGVDLDKYRPLEPADRERVRSGLGLAPDETMVLFVGRFSDQKAPESFLDVIRGLRRRNPRVRGFMCGHGPLAERLATLVRDDPPGVEILGLRSDVPALLGACDLFVSTSRNEGLPLNVMEAMSAGAAFVAPGIPQIRELTAEEPVLEANLTAPPPAGGIVPEDTIADWIARAEAVLADSEGARAIGRVGRDVIAQRFSLARMISDYERIFLDAAGGAGHQ